MKQTTLLLWIERTDERAPKAIQSPAMASFSQRYGYKPARKVLQIESIDSELRNSLWSTFNDLVLSGFENHRWGQNYSVRGSNLDGLFHGVWCDIFKAPTDSMPNDFTSAVLEVRKWFFACAWNEVYDFVEHVSSWLSERSLLFDHQCNDFLERENADVRIMGHLAVRVTGPGEVAAIDDALSSTDRGVRQHLAAALRLLSDRHNPDYRNSIKESISAVESLCRFLSSNEKATLGDALKVVANTSRVHPALRDAYLKIYGYTSDEGGIRHSMFDEAAVDYTDAKYMLVACSAFIGYLLGKSAGR